MAHEQFDHDFYKQTTWMCQKNIRTWAVTCEGFRRKKKHFVLQTRASFAVPGGKVQRLAVSQHHLDLFQNTDTKIPKFIMFTP